MRRATAKTEERFGGFSARAGVVANEDIALSSHATRTKFGIKPPLIRHDDPSEHPVIVDIGGIDVLALEVGPGSERETVLVRWRNGKTWATTTEEVRRAAVLRDATTFEIERGVEAAGTPAR